MSALRIDVFSDLGCPWCFIGERRLDRALEGHPDLEVEWRWRPFLLQPDLPKQGMPFRPFIEAKFGSRDRVQAMFDHITAVGAGDGLAFDFSRVANAPNTVDAHRLVLWAEPQGRQREMARALFRAYFAEGRDLTNPDTLAQAAGEAGLDATAARAWLLGSDGIAQVDASVQEAMRLGITGVPFYVFQGKWAVSGAQPPEAFEQAIETAFGAGGA
jgi:predicted DsbA family dithiol-disulfide isomerase